MDEVKEQFEGRLRPRTGGLALSICTAAYIAAQLIFSLIISAAGLSPDSDGYKYLAYLSAPVGIIAGIAVTFALTKQKFTAVAAVKCNFKYYIIAVLIFFGLTFSVSYVNELFLKFLQLFGYVPRTDESYVPSLAGGLIVPAILVIAAIPAVVEEFLFRGVILKNVRAGVGDGWTIVIVGLSFALFHASAEQTIYQFICGCAFAFIAVRAGSFLPCVMAHFLNNASILVLYAVGIYSISGAADIALKVVGAVAVAAGILWLILDKKPFKRGEKGGVTEFFKYASVGIAVLAALWIASLFAR